MPEGPGTTPGTGRLGRRRPPLLGAATRWAIHHSVTTVAQAARLTPVIWAARRQVVVERNVPYVPGRRDWAHRLDIHRPRGGGPWPVVLYVHGGGFGLLSKDSHWHIATALASHGFWVANINYRLAPRHPYPAALEDAASALRWTAAHAESRGGDMGRLVLAGESAGANLITALTLAATQPFANPWAESLRQQGIHIRAVLPACGLLEVSDADRYSRLTPHASPRLLGHIRAVCERYTQGSRASDLALGLASPVRLLESDWPLQAPLPPFFITCGARDPILSDSQRLHAALLTRGQDSQLALYPGEGHAFAAMPWRRRAKDHWRDTVAFLRQRLA